MKKSAFTIVLLASCLAFGACSSYPTWVPDWAQIGADQASITRRKQKHSSYEGYLENSVENSTGFDLCYFFAGLISDI